MPPERARVFVADDHPVFREGLIRAIRSRAELEFVGEAGDGRTALEEIRRLEPDVALLDVKMPGLDGTQVATRSVATTCPHASCCCTIGH